MHLSSKGDKVFNLILDNNKKEGNTTALYTAYYGSDEIAGLPAGSTVKNSQGENIVVTDAIDWNKSVPITLGSSAIDTVDGTEVKINTGETEAEAETEGKTDTKVVEAMKSAAARAANTEINGLNEAVAKTKTVTETAGTAKAELEKAKVQVSDSDTVTLYVQPYLDIKVKDAEVKGSGGGESTTEITAITLDIKAMVKTIASTATSANKIDTTGGECETKNAVQIGEAKTATVKTPVTITIPLPSGFVNGENTSVYVKHTKDDKSMSYVYTAKVSSKKDTGEATTQATTHYYATFVNPHGFSEFVLTKSNPAVAGNGTEEYADLQSAIDAANDCGKITIKKAGMYNVKIGGSTDKTIKFESGVENGTITINTNVGTVTLANKGDAGSVTYYAPKTPTTTDTPIVIPSYTPSYSGSSSSSGNTYSWYFNPTPTPTPVPVMVAPAVALPKTGDMTIWQSILSFFGLI